MVACETVVIGAWAKALSKTVPWPASASSCGVRPRVEPRKPMRSARVVSRVTRTTFGRAAASAETVVSASRRAQGRMKKEGAWIVPDSLSAAGDATRLELQAQRPLEGARSPLRDHGVALVHVRRGRELAERGAADARGGETEVRAVEQVESLDPELDVKAVVDPRVLDQGQVPLRESRTPDHVARAGADGAVGGDGEDLGVGDVVVGIARVVAD